VPWACKECGAEVRGDDEVRPGCRARKTSWTVLAERTRTIVLTSRGFTLY